MEFYRGASVRLAGVVCAEQIPGARGVDVTAEYVQSATLGEVEEHIPYNQQVHRPQALQGEVKASE